MIRRRRMSSCARLPAVRHHLDLLRKPTGKNPRQPRKPLSTDGGPLGPRLNCDREFWILLRFFESRRGHGLVPAAYRGDGNQWNFELEDAGSGTRWLVEVTEATTTERVEERQKAQPDEAGRLAPGGP
jgi:hypothetical protein